MVDFDALKAKAEGLVGEHADQVKQGIDKAGDFVTGKIGYGDQVQGVARHAVRPRGQDRR